MSVLVSAIIPCFNSEKWIIETLDSVYSQTYPNIEVIIVDDGSTDKTREIVKNYGENIVYIYQKNKGPSAARNLGIKNAKGDYIAFLDSDDMWEKNKLLKQVDFMEKNKDIMLTFSNVKVVDESGGYLYTHRNRVPVNRKELITAFFLGKITMNTPTIVVRKAVIDIIEGFDEGLPMREDHYFLMCIADKFSIKHFEEPLVRRRVNEISMSNSVEQKKIIEVFTPFIKKSIKRFPYLNRYKKAALSQVNMSAGKGYWKQGDYRNSAKIILKAICLNPFVFRNYIFFVLVLLRVNQKSFALAKMSFKRKVEI